MDKNNMTWMALKMYCPNCGKISIGYMNDSNKIKYDCMHCHLVMVRSYKNRRQDILELTIPKGTERLRG